MGSDVPQYQDRIGRFTVAYNAIDTGSANG